VTFPGLLDIPILMMIPAEKEAFKIREKPITYRGFIEEVLYTERNGQSFRAFLVRQKIKWGECDESSIHENVAG
jgi:hypothetical protein